MILSMRRPGRPFCAAFMQQEVPVFCQFGAFVQQTSALARAIWDELVYRSIKARIAWGTTRGHDEGCIYAGLAAFGCKRTRWQLVLRFGEQLLVCL